MAKRTYHLHLKGYVGGYDFNANYVDYVLDKYKDEEVHVLINSLGGSVATALSVSAAFKRHGNVHVHYEGMNASAATIASLGAKTVTIDRNAMYLVHQCSQEFFLWDGLNADQLEDLIANLEKTKNDLNKIDLNIAGGYAARCKKEKAELLDLMREGGWLSAEEAQAWGFVDEVTDLPEDEKPHMTAEVKDFMAAAGIPMPNLPMDDDDERGLLSRFREFLRSIYPNRETTNQIISTMKKRIFTVIAAILAVETFECEEGGSASLTDEQLATLENHINGLQGQVDEAHAQLVQRDTDIEGLKAQIAAKDAEIAELSKQPAASTQQVTNQNQAPAEPSQLQDYCAEVTGAQKMLDELNK